MEYISNSNAFRDNKCSQLFFFLLIRRALHALVGVNAKIVIIIQYVDSNNLGLFNST